jgi:hypothetical protein
MREALSEVKIDKKALLIISIMYYSPAANAYT